MKIFLQQAQTNFKIRSTLPLKGGQNSFANRKFILFFSVAGTLLKKKNKNMVHIHRKLETQSENYEMCWLKTTKIS